MDRPVVMSTAPSSTVPSEAQARTFSTSMVVSGIRCLLTYVLFPWLLPVLGVATSIGPAIGLPIAVVAIYFNVRSILRFRSAGHRLKWMIIPINVSVIVLLVVLMGLDIADLNG